MKKTKKISYYLLLSLLTLGASVIIGFLSFGGMYALWPVLLPAVATFALSTAYEGEIYLQNLKGALNKLFFKRDYLKRHLAKDYLLKNFPDGSNANDPQFFKDYKTQLKLLQPFLHKHLSKAECKQKKQLEKTLSDMEKWFALQLFSEDEGHTGYEKELRKWISDLIIDQKKVDRPKLEKRRIIFHGVKLFSLLAGVFMSLGTTYLLSETFAVIPFLSAISVATLPLIIAPLAVIAGAAYGLLTYNAVTDMINNDTLRKWSRRIWQEAENSWVNKSLKSALIVFSAIALFALTVALTVCTAGTWWTVTKNTRPLFGWMGKMPNFVMGIINPIITSVSAFVFNTENTCETLEFISETTPQKENIFKRMLNSLAKSWQKLITKENFWQVINPFRLVLKITLMPLRILLFAGHLISIGVTADRMPGLSEMWSALLGILSEGFEDLHYFFGHEHDHDHDKATINDMLKERLESGHGHDHSADLPTRLLKLCFAPLYFLAAAWDCVASQRNTSEEKKREKLSFTEAWEKQTGQKKIVKADKIEQKKTVKDSEDWRKAQACYRLKKEEKRLQKVIIGKDTAQDKAKHLATLREKIANTKDKQQPVKKLLDEEARKSVYSKQRFFFAHQKTHTQEFLENLSVRVSPAS